MSIETVFPYIFFGVFALVIGYLLIKIFKHGGFKGAMFGAPVADTLGEVTAKGQKIIQVSVKVHRLGGEIPDRAVGIELIAKGFASYQMMPVALSKSEARRLSQLLQSAITETDST